MKIHTMSHYQIKRLNRLFYLHEVSQVGFMEDGNIIVEYKDFVTLEIKVEQIPQTEA